MKLTDTACRAAKPALKQYKLTDGAGLYLLVKPTGGKCWQMRYTFLGKEKTYSIGLYPLVSLAEARDARTLAKKALKAGIDPTEAKREEKQKAIRKAGNTFKATALEWHETQKGRWTEQHAQNVLHRLERDVFPHIGNRPIEGVKAPDLLDLLRKIEKRGALDIAGRTRQICGQVFRYGIQIGRCENNPAESLRGALKPRKTTHYCPPNASCTGMERGSNCIKNSWRYLSFYTFWAKWRPIKGRRLAKHSATSKNCCEFYGTWAWDASASAAKGVSRPPSQRILGLDFKVSSPALLIAM